MNKSSAWRSVASLALTLLVLSLGTLCSRAQQTLGSINGTVFDSSGAAVPGAQVTVTDESINVVRTTTSQSDGFFQIFDAHKDSSADAFAGQLAKPPLHQV